MLYADGKVITPLFRAKPGDKKVDKATGEVHYPRAEQDAAFHVEGTGEMVWGTKFVLIAARHARRAQPLHRRRRVRRRLPAAKRRRRWSGSSGSREHLPGAQGVVYDTALRGVHHQRLMRELGWVSVNRVTAAAGSRKRGGGKNRRRVEKLVYVETKTVRTPDRRDHGAVARRKADASASARSPRPVSRCSCRSSGCARTATPTSGGRSAGTTTTGCPNASAAGVVTVRLHANRRGRQTEVQPSRERPPDRAGRSRLRGRCTGAATMPRASTDTSTTRCGCAAPTRSVTAGSC